MRKIEYGSFEEAFIAMMEFVSRGIRCKGVSKTTLIVWDGEDN